MMPKIDYFSYLSYIISHYAHSIIRLCRLYYSCAQIVAANI